MKWQQDENKKIYIFAMYNFKFIVATRFAKALKPFIEYDDNNKVVSIRFNEIESINQFYPNLPKSGMSTPSKFGSDADLDDDVSNSGQNQVKKKGKRAKQFGREWYDKLVEYLSDTQQDERPRKRSTIRSRLNKLFLVEESSIDDMDEKSQIRFKDVIEVFLKHKDKFHCSSNFRKVEVPFEKDEQIIMKQIKKYFPASADLKEKGEKIESLEEKELNRLEWGAVLTLLYPEFCKHIQKMEKQKEIFKRNSTNDPIAKHQYKRFMQEMDFLTQKVEKALLYANAEYHLMKQNPRMAKMIKDSSKQRCLEKGNLIQLLKSTTAKNTAKKKNSKKESQHLKKRKKPISEFGIQWKEINAKAKSRRRKKSKSSLINSAKALKNERRMFDEDQIDIETLSNSQYMGIELAGPQNMMKVENFVDLNQNLDIEQLDQPLIEMEDIRFENKDVMFQLNEGFMFD